MVILDRKLYDKLMADVPTFRLITPSMISERLKVNVSVARAAIRKLHAEGLITPISQHHAQSIYVRVTATA